MTFKPFSSEKGHRFALRCGPEKYPSVCSTLHCRKLCRHSDNLPAFMAKAKPFPKNDYFLSCEWGQCERRCLRVSVADVCTDIGHSLKIKIDKVLFSVQGSVHRKFYIQIYFQLDATLYSSFISGKLLYMFWVVSPPIIRSTQLYLQRLVLVKPLLLPVAIVEELEMQCISNSSTIAAGSSNGLTSTRRCKYSCVCS